tara:strand:- start:107 stop:2899 length:2793 start_codon:yes stop_codon:yes gene_type:complete
LQQKSQQQQQILAAPASPPGTNGVASAEEVSEPSLGAFVVESCDGGDAATARAYAAGETLPSCAQLRGGWHSYLESMLTRLIEAALAMGQPNVAAAHALYALRCLHPFLPPASQQPLLALLSRHAPHPDAPPRIIGGLGLPWLLRLTPLPLDDVTKPHGAAASKGGEISGAADASASVFIYSHHEAQRQRAADAAAAAHVVWVAEQRCWLELCLSNPLAFDLTVDVQQLITTPPNVLRLVPATVTLPAHTATAAVRICCRPAWPQPTAVASADSDGDAADGNAGVAVELRGVAMSAGGFGCVHPIDAMGAAVVASPSPSSPSLSVVSSAEAPTTLPTGLRIPLSPPLPLLAADNLALEALRQRQLLSGQRIVLPIRLANTGELPLTHVDVSVKQRATPLSLGMAGGFRWYEHDDPLALFDEDEVPATACTDAYRLDLAAVRQQLPVLPGGVLLLPLQARLFTPDNQCEVSISYRSGSEEAKLAAPANTVDAADASPATWSGGGAASSDAVAASWHRVLVLRLAIPNVAPGVVARGVQVVPPVSTTETRGDGSDDDDESDGGRKYDAEAQAQAQGAGSRNQLVLFDLSYSGTTPLEVTGSPGSGGCAVVGAGLCVGPRRADHPPARRASGADGRGTHLGPTTTGATAATAEGKGEADGVRVTLPLHVAVPARHCVWGEPHALPRSWELLEQWLQQRTPPLGKMEAARVRREHTAKAALLDAVSLRWCAAEGDASGCVSLARLRLDVAAPATLTPLPLAISLELARILDEPTGANLSSTSPGIDGGERSPSAGGVAGGAYTRGTYELRLSAVNTAVAAMPPTFLRLRSTPAIEVTTAVGMGRADGGDTGNADGDGDGICQLAESAGAGALWLGAQDVAVPSLAADASFSHTSALLLGDAGSWELSAGFVPRRGSAPACDSLLGRAALAFEVT